MKKKWLSCCMLLVMLSGLVAGKVEAKAQEVNETYIGNAALVEVQPEKELSGDSITSSDRFSEDRGRIDIGKSDLKLQATSTTTGNSDPNGAIAMTNDQTIQGNLTEEGQAWYTFTLTEKSKVTIRLLMQNTLDADIYMCSLDNSTHELTLFDGCATDTLGITEQYERVLNPGTYYFVIAGKKGTGRFAFLYYQSNQDAENEVNNSIETATPVAMNQSVQGVIDHPRDVDYYSITVDQVTAFKYTISSNQGYQLDYAGKKGESAGIFHLAKNSDAYKILPGTYYFAVYTNEGKYSATDSYSIEFKRLGALSSDASITYVGVCEKAQIVFESNADGTVNYVNGHPIDISYSFYEDLSNSAGTQIYDISIDGNAGAQVNFGENVSPEVIKYVDSNRAITKVESKPLLLLTYRGDRNFYHIHVSASGAYKMNRCWADLNRVRLLFDPDTGKLVDILETNYYYDLAPLGSNEISWFPMEKLKNLHSKKGDGR